MNTYTEDIISTIDKFMLKSNPDDRYSSFDYCYNYFSVAKNFENDLERSCLTLGFYLSSWGMYRGSSFILQKSVVHFKPIIQYINSLDRNFWDIDVDNYSEENIKTIIEIYNQVKKRLILKNNSDLTLVTKVLLGVFGFVPAYDEYFCNSFRTIFKNKCGFRVFNQNSLLCIKNFYESNKKIIDEISNNTYTTDFLSENKTKIKYTKAKIIDMYGFTKSLKK